MIVGPPRITSVDALRGITVAAMLLVNDPGDWDHVFWPLDHAAWNGTTPTDFIFPMFLFVMGVSIALVIVPRLEQGRAHSHLRLRGHGADGCRSTRICGRRRSCCGRRVGAHWCCSCSAGWSATWVGHPLGRHFGMNAITAYAGSEFMQVLLPATGLQALLYGPLNRALTPLAGPYVASLSFAVLFVIAWWIIVWVMDRRGWYLKI